MIALFEIAVSAKHLTIIRCRFAAFAPRNDVVSLHFLELKGFAAVCAFVTLLFIGSERVAAVKGTDRQLLFFSGQ